MKSSSIGRVPNDAFVMLRRSYISICADDRCAAMLLANFEFWHNGKLEDIALELSRARDDRKYTPRLSTWVYRSTQDLIDGLLGMYKRDNVLKAVKLLSELGYIRLQADPENAFNKKRYFELMPDNVNAALEIHSGRKIDYRGAENLNSRSRKIDSLPNCKEVKEEGRIEHSGCASCGGCGEVITTKVIRGMAMNRPAPCPTCKTHSKEKS